jgi:hypothetical protein
MTLTQGHPYLRNNDIYLYNWISFLRKMHFSNESRKRKTICSWPLTLIMQKRDHFRLVTRICFHKTMTLTQGHPYLRNNDVYLYFTIFCIYTIRYNVSKSKHTRFTQHRYFCKSVFRKISFFKQIIKTTVFIWFPKYLHVRLTRSNALSKHPIW